MDGTGIGGTIGASDPTTLLNFNLTTSEIRGRDGTLASTGTANVMHSESSDALGVDSVNTANEGPNENDARDFDPGEAWTFSFDVDVQLVETAFDGWVPNESEVTLSFSNETPDKVLSGDTASPIFDLERILIRLLHHARRAEESPFLHLRHDVSDTWLGWSGRFGLIWT